MNVFLTSNFHTFKGQHITYKLKAKCKVSSQKGIDSIIHEVDIQHCMKLHVSMARHFLFEYMNMIHVLFPLAGCMSLSHSPNLLLSTPYKIYDISSHRSSSFALYGPLYTVIFPPYLNNKT